MESGRVRDLEPVMRSTEIRGNWSPSCVVCDGIVHHKSDAGWRGLGSAVDEGGSSIGVGDRLQRLDAEAEAETDHAHGHDGLIDEFRLLGMQCIWGSIKARSFGVIGC